MGKKLSVPPLPDSARLVVPILGASGGSGRSTVAGLMASALAVAGRTVVLDTSPRLASPWPAWATKAARDELARTVLALAHRSWGRPAAGLGAARSPLSRPRHRLCGDHLKEVSSMQLPIWAADTWHVLADASPSAEPQNPIPDHKPELPKNVDTSSKTALGWIAGGGLLAYVIGGLVGWLCAAIRHQTERAGLAARGKKGIIWSLDSAVGIGLTSSLVWTAYQVTQ